MRFIKVQDFALNIEESIKSTTIASSNELVMLTSSGTVTRYNISEQTWEPLFSVKSSMSYSDGGFDIEAPSTIYTLDSIVVIVNDYKRHGYVHYPGKYGPLHLWREDYHANISCYPIALFKNEADVPHLIYGEAWNHVQIMNLDTRQILTAAKSLIEENAEETYLEYREKYESYDDSPWPTPYDYFFGKLAMAPDQKHFLSAGWVWGSYDAYAVYDVNHFIHSNRISEKALGGWDHCERGACWIDNVTVVVAYDPHAEGEEGATKDSPQEIHFYNITYKESVLERKIKIRGIDLVNAQLYFNKDIQALIACTNQGGVVVLSLEGEKLLQDQTMTQVAYYPNLNLFLKVENQSITIYQIGR
ncbi:hypothetical protein BKI52_06860 [marine bacterium AO1-C]|nr:hypothetical protein BKI52_06860 [marine bacterium AO1-C]